jgi:hypothetical protein
MLDLSGNGVETDIAGSSYFLHRIVRHRRSFLSRKERSQLGNTRRRRMDARVGTHSPSSTLATAARRRRILRVSQAAAISIILYFTYLNIKPRASNHCLHSTTSPTSLPSYYTLPSGDRIPSLALGKSSKCYTSHISYPRPIGVWKADKTEVGQAVKVGSPLLSQPLLFSRRRSRQLSKLYVDIIASLMYTDVCAGLPAHRRCFGLPGNACVDWALRAELRFPRTKRKLGLLSEYQVYPEKIFG